MRRLHGAELLHPPRVGCEGPRICGVAPAGQFSHLQGVGGPGLTAAVWGNHLEHLAAALAFAMQQRAGRAAFDLRDGVASLTRGVDVAVALEMRQPDPAPGRDKRAGVQAAVAPVATHTLWGKAARVGDLKPGPQGVGLAKPACSLAYRR